jgi:hypothetical protein
VTPLEFPLLTDENIAPDAVEIFDALRASTVDVNRRSSPRQNDSKPLSACECETAPPW